MATKSRTFSSRAWLILRNQSSAASTTVLRRVPAPAPSPASSLFDRQFSISSAPGQRGTAAQWRTQGYESESDKEDDERFRPDAINRKLGVFNRKVRRHKELLKNFEESDTLDDAFKWMDKIEKFEAAHYPLRPEYRVIGELMNRLKVADSLKDRFILQQKISRGLRLVHWKEANDPNDPENYTKVQTKGVWGQAAMLLDEDPVKRLEAVDANDSDNEELFNDMKEKDDALLAKINAIDKKLEEKLAELDYTFGKRGKLLEEEIKMLAEERNTLTEKKRTPLFRKGFEMKVLNVNRSNKITKKGRISQFSAIVACGNYNGVIGFAKASGPSVPVAVQKAREKVFQNLHYIDRHEEHTIAHAIIHTYKRTKLYLWPAGTGTGLIAGRKNTQIILSLAGFKNIKSKVVGSRNPYNTIKAVFMALNAIETPKDVQEKFGRTVVEKYLL